MQRKTSAAEGLGYFIAFLTLIGAVSVTKLIVDPSIDDPKLVLALLFLWPETLLLFVGLIQRSTICMKAVKWLSFVKCFILILEFLNRVFYMDQENLDSSERSALFDIYLVGAVVIMGWNIFVACIAHHLYKFYTHLQDDDLQGVVLITAMVYEGPVSTQPPAQKGLPAEPPTSTEQEKPKEKEFPAWV